MHLGMSLKKLVAALAVVAGCGFAIGQLLARAELSAQLPSDEPPSANLVTPITRFLVVAGGGAPSYNEIALEKNVRYFQRTLAGLGFDPAAATVYFANGADGQATVRYLNPLGQERFKVPDIPNLSGAATPSNLLGWLERSQAEEPCPRFFYFTGHGALNRENADNNALILWGEQLMSVQALATALEPLPADQPFVAMMAQCYAGSFANLIYEGGNPENPVALQTRCGFFATIKTQPSVGCTPLVNEADYEDYSSSFFAGLIGRDRIGNPAPSADYNQDGQVSYAEAHAFSKVDAKTTDLPISTVEAWLQRQASQTSVRQILARPLTELRRLARPEQGFVIDSLVQELGFSPAQSFNQNLRQQPINVRDEVQKAYGDRLRMELVNVATESKIRQQGNQEALAVLDKLLTCEAGTWE